MDSQIQDLVDTSREILSQQTGRSRISWPDDFKKKVIEELSRGYSVKDISQATGISVPTMNRWKPKKNCKRKRFKKLHLGFHSEVSSLVLISLKGTEIRGLSFAELSELLKSGLL